MEKLIATLGPSGTVIAGYLILVNILALVLFGVDKMLAKKTGARRISESTLLIVAILGGSVGAFFSMKIFRHKTKHKKFFIGIPVIFILELALAIYLIVVL